MSDVLGHGIDLVPVERVADLLERHADRALDRLFTPSEQEYANASKRRLEHLAARFAAKEAVLKALGTGWSRGIAWTDVEVVSGPAGAPRIELHGKAAEIARELGVARVLVTLTHTGDHAAASAIALSV